MHSFLPRSAPAFLNAVLTVALAATFMTTASCTSKSRTADARFAAVYTAEWKWRQEQFPDDEDSPKPIQDHLAKGAPDKQQMRLRRSGRTWATRRAPPTAASRITAIGSRRCTTSRAIFATRPTRCGAA